VARSSAKSVSSKHGDVLTAISDGMVALLKEFYGRGPTRAKSYYEDDLVVCLLRGVSPEQRRFAGGRDQSVIQQRMGSGSCARFTAVIEQATGRHVIGFERQPAAPRHDVRVFILTFGPRRRRRGIERRTPYARPGETDRLASV
jgi:uncharacterized protein YbcI